MDFAALPKKYTEYKTSKIIVLPIPYDGTATLLPGSDLGPQAILAASSRLTLFDLETSSEVYRQGICTLPPVLSRQNPVDMIDEVRQQAIPLFRDGKLVVGLGGKHLVSIGLIQAAAERYSELSVVQFDAHADLHPIDAESVYGNSCVMTRVNEMCDAVQIGIRSMDQKERGKVDLDRMVFARDLHYHGVSAAGDALDMLSDTVYITIDLDVLDPSCMPSVERPEPGGIDWYMLTRLIRQVASEKRIVGLDVVGLVPQPNHPAADFLAAKLIYRILSMIFSR
ncbi:MAG: agmatinase [Desulfocapsaceae bacterium]|nr:agmatinase [Desulfocapsaceae bacterium]